MKIGRGRREGEGWEGGGAGEDGKIERGEDLGPSAVGAMLCWPVVVEDFSYHFQERAPGFCLEGVQRCISLVPRPGGGPRVGGQDVLPLDWEHTRNIRVPRGVAEMRHPCVLLDLLMSTG